MDAGESGTSLASLPGESGCKPVDKPLEGLLVVSVEQAVAAPTCTLRLADAGARVIKVERKEGETARHYDNIVEGFSAYFAWLNRGKESVCLDLKNDADIALLKRMIARADIFVQNMLPGAAQRMGIGAAQLMQLYPSLIVLDIVGYGQDTPYRHMRAYDMLVQAESGICSVTGTPETPSKVGVSVADIGAGMAGYAAILEALLVRERTGRGRAIEIAMFDCMADWMTVPLLHYEHGGSEMARHGLSHGSIYPYGTYDCRDGQVAIAVQQPAEWERFCRGVLVRPELINDPRFANNPARVINRSLLDEQIGEVTRLLSLEELTARLEASRIAWGRMSTVGEALRHPALRRLDVPLENGSSFSLPRPPGHTDSVGRPPPILGAHTEEIRAEFPA